MLGDKWRCVNWVDVLLASYLVGLGGGGGGGARVV